MQIIRGKQKTALKVVVYGPEGIGKSTFAAQFPNPLFIDTEGGTKHMDVARTPKPTSWVMLLGLVKECIADPSLCGTLIIDTMDWAELLCSRYVCDKNQKKSIEEFGYGNQAILHLRVDAPDGESEMNVNLFLLKRFEWKLCQFFTSIGLRQHGEKLRMNWAAVTGKTGRCRITKRTYKDKTGADRETNDLDEFLDPLGAPSMQQAGGFTPGAF